MNTDLFLIALYNLHLPTEIPPPNEVKQKLTETVFRYYRISPGVIREPSATPNYNGDFRPIDYRIPIADGREVTIAKDCLGYQPSDVDWWETDYPSFLKEYAHIRSFLDSYLEGKFKNLRRFQQPLERSVGKNKADDNAGKAYDGWTP